MAVKILGVVPATPAASAPGDSASAGTAGDAAALATHRHAREAPNIVLTTLQDSLVGPTGLVSVGVANDCAFFAVQAEATETWSHFEVFTGSTFVGTSNTDVGVYDVNGSRLFHSGLATLNSTWGTPGTSAYALLSLGAGVAVTAGATYYIAFYMVSATDGFRGSNASLSGARLRNVNQKVYGKLAGQTGCPTSFTPSTLVAIGYTFLVNILAY